MLCLSDFELYSRWVPLLLYLYNTNTSVKRTLGFVPLVSLLKRFDCTHFKAKRGNCKHVNGTARIQC